MPIRLEPFLNNYIYHVFNKTIDKKIIFANEDYCNHFYQTLRYYRSTKASKSFSQLKKLEKTSLEDLLKKVSLKKYFKVSILAYAFMPTHYHLLIRQKQENGISKYISDVINSLTHYYNIKNERKGPIFLPKFKSVMVKTDEQLIHVTRYIHLNIYSSGMINKIADLINYSWSSYVNYLGKKDDDLVENATVLALFNFNKDRYKKFVESNAEHQKNLEMVKYAQNW